MEAMPHPLCRGHRQGGEMLDHCRACARHDPLATGAVLHPWVRSRYISRGPYSAGVTVHECDDYVSLSTHAANVAQQTGHVCEQGLPPVTSRKTALRWIMLGLAAAAFVAGLLATVAAQAAATAQCGPWNPAADPYQGDQAEAVMRLAEIPEAERRQLADMARQQYGWQRVMVSRTGVVGADLIDLRSMNFGAGRICAGPVDRSTWPAGRYEAARAYTVGRWSVLVFDSCRNVAMATNAAALPPSRPYTAADVRAGYRGGLGALGAPMAVSEPASLGLGAVALIGVLAMSSRRRA